ncbi:bifunctional UDP-N-acetylglucosamine diphosphorylase/glucosamine-1-phosphate N-acetyltransferase GlmU [Erythrobacter sp. LQ02-29]|uniref:bifunctional UDP-N-acetylglucosamine diphosphorylase/glucosamine-1-phosphate N-acetyltransferase GlmU n=1 Tax=Erythrobacter sp. LQ02-29 TaxID=2920384 RepID=UPI001F4F1096|nr:bifunctional UDP-N-acetylglucosamine diphosphorylase/glucosamine-1-phosphate N-acetyltransferase GlmU [Erythrobacter sp. LQ02-29]MCP9222703.1 bifunctional UDP-N-acetylglucosamine diphosphorylase/glucosamine-1-phosphate N-acetyltransferase GlmU [Erythrobacter sp. LQ02-29]
MVTQRAFAAIVLAAGKGTRMKSDLHKVLQPIAGRPMLEHLLASVAELAPQHTVVVTGHGREQIETQLGERATIAHQEPQLGTGHAVQQAESALAGFEGDVLILYGDVPFVTADTMRRMVARLHEADAPPCVVLAFRAADPGAYGRIVSEDDRTIGKMVEFKDATAAERQLDLCNSGMMAVRSEDLFGLLARVTNDNAAGEYYLPDIVMVAQKDGRVSALVETDEAEVQGINSRAELARAEAQWQADQREHWMAEGATLRAPETVFFSYDTTLGRDVTVEPNVVFGPGVTVAAGAHIRAFSHLEGARVGEGCEVGPYARLRPGAVLERDAKVGNFVEVKKATLGEGAKANHLSYLGDAEIGAGANIGAGTITCNYDGYFKYKTTIGPRAFIGSNSALVAPVRIGADAIVGAGSTVTRDVGDGELRLVRADQNVKPGWADRFHDTMKRKKAAETK